MKTKNQFSLSSKYLLLILAIVCIILMGLSGFAEILAIRKKKDFE